MTPYPQANYSLWRFIRTNEKGWKLFYVAVLILYFVVVRGIRGDGLWYIDVFLGLLTVAAVIRDVRIRKRLRKLNATPGNFHYPDVCEGCDPVCMSDGSPIKNIVWWMAARHNVSREMAQQLWDDALPGGQDAIFKMHAKYLQHPKFDKFRS